MAVVFLGHRDAPESLYPEPLRTVERLVADGVTNFYVGNEGNFDKMVRQILRTLAPNHPQIRWAVVFAYLNVSVDSFGEGETLYPEGLELTPYRYRISKRNRWMLTRADTVVVCATVPLGNAFRMRQLAEHLGKNVICLL